MAEEDSESAATDSQTEEDGELPVIQLCGLVEELRYRHRGPLRPQRQPANHPGLRRAPRGHSPLRWRRNFFGLLLLLLAYSFADKPLMEPGIGVG